MKHRVLARQRAAIRRKAIARATTKHRVIARQRAAIRRKAIARATMKHRVIARQRAAIRRRAIARHRAVARYKARVRYRHAVRRIAAKRRATAHRRAATRRKADVRRRAATRRRAAVRRRAVVSRTDVRVTHLPAFESRRCSACKGKPAPTTTTTPPPPVPSGPGTGWNGFRFDALPGAGWRPYAASSPFNQSTAGVPVHPSSAAMVNRILSWGRPASLTAGNADTANDFGHPVYFSQADDPLVTLDGTASWGTSSVEGMRIPVPARARPAGGDDGHMVIVTPDGWEYDLWRATAPSAGRLQFSWGGRTRVDGDGLGGGATASGFGGLAGIIRPEELASGQINHALFVVLRCTSTSTGFGYSVRAGTSSDSSFVYPAKQGDAPCSGGENDGPPMGARLSMAITDQEIDALAIPAYRKTILRALARYGGYVGDTGGSGFGVQMQSGSTYTSFGREDAAVAYARASGVPSWEGQYIYNVADGIDWARYLRVLVPPSA